MTTYLIHNNGLEVGFFEAESEAAAVLRYLRDTGYASPAEAASVLELSTEDFLKKISVREVDRRMPAIRDRYGERETERLTLALLGLEGDEAGVQVLAELCGEYGPRERTTIAEGWVAQLHETPVATLMTVTIPEEEDDEPRLYWEQSLGGPVPPVSWAELDLIALMMGAITGPVKHVGRFGAAKKPKKKAKKKVADPLAVWTEALAMLVAQHEVAAAYHGAIAYNDESNEDAQIQANRNQTAIDALEGFISFNNLNMSSVKTEAGEIVEGSLGFDPFDMDSNWPQNDSLAVTAAEKFWGTADASVEDLDFNDDGSDFTEACPHCAKVIKTLPALAGVDWRPQETVPEDYYALGAKKRKAKQFGAAERPAGWVAVAVAVAENLACGPQEWTETMRAQAMMLVSYAMEGAGLPRAGTTVDFMFAPDEEGEDPGLWLWMYKSKIAADDYRAWPAQKEKTLDKLLNSMGAGLEGDPISVSGGTEALWEWVAEILKDAEGGVDWRPRETVPEDYYALGAKKRKAKALPHCGWLFPMTRADCGPQDGWGQLMRDAANQFLIWQFESVGLPAAKVEVMEDNGVEGQYVWLLTSTITDADIEQFDRFQNHDIDNKLRYLLADMDDRDYANAPFRARGVMKDLLVIMEAASKQLVAPASPDWRPDHAIAEDYYAMGKLGAPMTHAERGRRGGLATKKKMASDPDFYRRNGRKGLCVAANKSGCDVGCEPGYQGEDCQALLTPQGTEFACYEIVPASRLITSHNPITWQPDPRYPAQVQERDYQGDRNEQMKVLQISRHIDPSILLANVPTPTDGPPIIAPGGVVLGGNGRSMALRLAYDAGTAGEYQYELSKRAALFGLDPERVNSTPQPVLVRVVQDLQGASQAELADASSRYNEGLTGSMDERARAVSLSRRLSPSTVALVAGLLEDGSLREAMEKHGRRIAAALRGDGLVTDQSASQYLEPGGGLTEAGKMMVEGALLGMAVGTPQRMAHAKPATLQRVERMLFPLVAVASRQNGQDLIPLVQAGMDALYSAQASGLTIQELATQIDFTRQPLPMRTVVAALLLEAPQRALGAAMRKWAQWADYDPRQSTLFGAHPTPGELLRLLAQDAGIVSEGTLTAVQLEPEVTHHPAAHWAPGLA